MPLRAPLLVLALLAAACTSASRTKRARTEELNRSLLERLLEGDSVTPVEDFDEEAYFEELENLYGDAPREEEPAVVDAEPGGDWNLGVDAINPYLEFGTRIWQDEATGFLIKPYPFPAGMGKDVMQLLVLYGDFEVDAAVVDGQGLPPIAEQRPEAAVLDLRTNFDAEAFTSPRPQGAALTPAKSVVLSDWLIVRARPPVLLEVEHFIELFSSDAREIEIEAKIVEVTTTDSFDYGIRPIDDSTPIFGLPNPGSLINSIDYSFGNTVETTEAIFGTTAVFDGVEFNALLELVSNYENVSIVSRPKVVAREGAPADIVNTREIPFFNIQSINANGTFKTNLDEVEVGVKMFIIPRIVGDDTIVLNIDIEVSQETGSFVVLATLDDEARVLTVPEVSKRATRTIVRLEPGQAVILGGLISERELERESKIPFLGDIPLLGYLFKSRFTEKEQTNVLFFIRPRILQGIEFAPEQF